MKYQKILTLCVLLFSANANAAYQWSGAPWGGDGAEIGVEAVYTQFGLNQLVFKGSDGKFYCYLLDASSAQVTQNANMVMSVLLTAFSVNKKVTLYFDNVPDPTSGHYRFIQAILLK